MYDIAIVGLGPAGATLARLLDKRYRVFAIDKKDPLGKGGFIKPCGGLLAPDAQKSLAKHGLTLCKDILADPQIFAVRTLDLKQNLLRYYSRSYINMDRRKFDSWLIGSIPSRVEIASNARCEEIHRSGSGFELRYSQLGEQKTVLSRYVVGADGANSIVRRGFFPNIKIRKYISIQQWFRDQNPRPLYSSFFDSGLTDCYAWGLSKDGYFIAGGAFPLNGGRKSFEELKLKLSLNGYNFKNPIKTEACLVLRPKNPLQCAPGRNGVFLSGEAAGLISPSSLEGISYALDSAAALAGAFNLSDGQRAPHAAYASGLRGIRAKLLLKNAKAFFMYNPAARRLIMKSGIASMRVEPLEEHAETWEGL